MRQFHKVGVIICLIFLAQILLPESIWADDMVCTGRTDCCCDKCTCIMECLPETKVEVETFLDLSEGDITINGSMYKQGQGEWQQGESCCYLIDGRSGLLTNHTITVIESSCKVTLCNAVMKPDNDSAIMLKNGAQLELTLQGKNVIKGVCEDKGIQVEKGCTLIQKGKAVFQVTKNTIEKASARCMSEKIYPFVKRSFAHKAFC